MSEPAGEGQGRLAENIAHFGRALRAAGLPVGPGSVIQAIRAVETAGIVRRDDLYWTLHAIFVGRREERPVFDELFRRFWRAGRVSDDIMALVNPVSPERPAEKPRPGAARAAAAMATMREQRRREEEFTVDATRTASRDEVLRKRDFAQMSAAEIAEAQRRIAGLRLPDDTLRTRRFAPSARQARFDARRTLRQSLRTGGKLPLPRFRQRREAPPPIVALLDISGSMSQYSRILLHFLHALARQRRVTTFVFGTRLTNVTRALRMKDPDEALAAASALVEDWSGGTRIASALTEFNRRWSRRVLGQSATVLLMTDGLEREGTEDLGAAMDRLARSCRRLIWLNPLLRFDGFEARARGIRAMLPHVDDFRSIHSLESMEELCRALSAPADADAARRLMAA